MRYSNIVIILLLFSGFLKSQTIDTLILHQPISKYDTLIYKRIIEFDDSTRLYHVKDYYDNGQIKMEGTYSSFDKNVKENYWCNYITNTKQGVYKTWYKNGFPESRCIFIDGKNHGIREEYYSNGQISVRSNWIQGNKEGNTKGLEHGNFKGWSKDGQLLYDHDRVNGLKINPIDTNYHYMQYLPTDYNVDSTKRWPLIIYLHGGSMRGTDLNRLYTYGIPDQIYRGREFPFIIVAPQCPVLIRWSTDNWFENFYTEIITKYRVDTNRIYLTGVSLGGAGTWYLAIKYSDKFAAIAPISGFTSHIDYIDKNIDNLTDIPIWAFHGKIDNVVPFEETERIINKLKGKNKELKFTIEPEIGHWIQKREKHISLPQAWV